MLEKVLEFRDFYELGRDSNTMVSTWVVCGNMSTCFSTYHAAGRREAIVSTCSPLLDRFMIKVSTQYTVNLVGILVAYLGRSAIKLLSPVPLISAVRFVYQGLIFDTMPICASCPETMLFLGFSAFQGVERERVCSTILTCCCGFCSQKRPPNLQS